MTRSGLVYLPTRFRSVVPVGPDSIAECTDPVIPGGVPIVVAVEGRPEVGDRAEVAWVPPSRSCPAGRWTCRPARAGEDG